MRRMFPMLHRGLPCCERQAYCLQVYQGHDVAVAARGVKRIESFGTQECSNTAWAFAKMHLRQAPLLAALSLRFQSRINEQAWTVLREEDQRLLSATSSHAQAKLPEHEPQNLSIAARTSAALGMRDEAPLSALLVEGLSRMEELAVQDLVNTGRTLATLAWPGVAVSKAAGVKALQTVDELDSQHLSRLSCK
eukprot:s3024_g4.t2